MHNASVVCDLSSVLLHESVSTQPGLAPSCGSSCLPYSVRNSPNLLPRPQILPCLRSISVHLLPARQYNSQPLEAVTLLSHSTPRAYKDKRQDALRPNGSQCGLVWSVPRVSGRVGGVLRGRNDRQSPCQGRRVHTWLWLHRLVYNHSEIILR